MAIGRARYADIAFRLPEGQTTYTTYPNATIKLYVAGTGTAGTDDGTPFTGTIYRAATGGTTYSNPFTTDDVGNIEFYLAMPQRLKIVVTGGLGTMVADYVSAYEDPIFNTQHWHPVRYYGWDASSSEAVQTAAIQAAIDAAAAAAAADASGDGRAVVLLENAWQVITTTLLIRKGVTLAGRGLLNDNVDPADAGAPTRLIWAGAAGGVMIQMRSATSGNRLTGAGVRDMQIDGNDLAGYGVVASTTQRCLLKNLYVSTVRSQGIRLDDANGQISRANRIEGCSWFAGTPGLNCDNAMGLVLEGSALWGVTQNRVEYFSGSHIDGATLYLGWSDANVFGQVDSSPIRTPASGSGIIFAGNTGLDPYPDSPTFGTSVTKYASGNTVLKASDVIAHGAGCKGNVIYHYSSEGGGITDADGTLSVNNIVDFVSGESHGTRGFAMKDRDYFGPGDLGSPDGTATRGGLAGIFDQWALADGATQTIAGVKKSAEWGPGTIVMVRVWYAIDAGQTGTKHVRFRLRLGCHAPGAPGSGTTLSYAYDATQDAVVDNNASALTFFDFAMAQAHARGEAVAINLQRIGGHANDDVSASTTVYVHGIEVWFQGSGPDSAGSGTYALGN